MTSMNLGQLIRDAKPNDYTPVPVGNYDVTVDSAEFKFTKAGDPMFVVVFVIDEGQPSAGRKLFRNITITEKSVNIAVDQLSVLGIEQSTLADALSDGGDPNVVCQQLVDAPAVVKVEHREWEGRTQSDVKRILPSKKVPGTAPASQPAAGSAARPNRPF